MGVNEQPAGAASPQCLPCGEGDSAWGSWQEPSGGRHVGILNKKTQGGLRVTHFNHINITEGDKKLNCSPPFFMFP